jgi:hypothetical protein
MAPSCSYNIYIMYYCYGEYITFAGTKVDLCAKWVDAKVCREIYFYVS